MLTNTLKQSLRLTQGGQALIPLNGVHWLVTAPNSHTTHWQTIRTVNRYNITTNITLPHNQGVAMGVPSVEVGSVGDFSEYTSGGYIRIDVDTQQLYEALSVLRNFNQSGILAVINAVYNTWGVTPGNSIKSILKQTGGNSE